jgi:hypothetical protein
MRSEYDHTLPQREIVKFNMLANPTPFEPRVSLLTPTLSEAERGEDTTTSADKESVSTATGAGEGM